MVQESDTVNQMGHGAALRPRAQVGYPQHTLRIPLYVSLTNYIKGRGNSSNRWVSCSIQMCTCHLVEEKKCSGFPAIFEASLKRRNSCKRETITLRSGDMDALFD